MCPLKPSLLTQYLHKPQPREVRQVHCPGCGRKMDISRRTLSLRCPSCSHPLRLEDITLRRELMGDLSTQGHVHVTQRSSMVGQLVCGEVTISGRYDGEVEAHGPVSLEEHSHTTGTIIARSLNVAPGATVEAAVRIGPLHPVHSAKSRPLPGEPA
ncbi:MAG: polymer-forming cytoskeletal protein [Phycisphaeraceae bacterium]|nr:polymer-forming cytoskeletal protein [Phycisphaeraceae bacterium]